MKENIQQKLLNVLVHSTTPISSKSLATQCKISEKTCLKYLNFLKQDIEQYGATINIKQGQGSYLSINNLQLFNYYLNETNAQDYLNNPSKRVTYIMTRLLTESEYINVYDFADELAISPSLLRSILRNIEQTLSFYNVRIIHSHLKGYKIEGNEKDVRNALLKECRSNINLNDFLNENKIVSVNIEEIRQIVTDILKNYDIALSNDGLRAFILHILISVNRFETHNIIENFDESDSYLRSTSEFFIVNSINRQLKKNYNIELPINELIYLTMHLSGKRRLSRHEHIHVKINNEALVLYNKFLRKIFQYAHIDFFNDNELRTSLLNHIIPFLQRYNNDMQIQESELADIKNQFPFAYDLTQTTLCSLFADKSTITNAEISYFTLHIALALEKNNSTKHKLNIAIIASDIGSLYHLLQYKLNKEFPDYINTITFIDSETMHLDQLHEYALILNTTDLILPINQSVIKVNPFLSDEDLSNIKNELEKAHLSNEYADIISSDLFFTIDSSSKEDTLCQMIKLINEHVSLPEQFYNSIMQRESFEPTSYNSGLACPHPLENERHLNFVSVAKLKHPIQWNQHKVQLIFLICLFNNPDFSSEFYKQINVLSNEPNIVKKLIQTADYDSFINQLKLIKK